MRKAEVKNVPGFSTMVQVKLEIVLDTLSPILIT